MLSILASSKQVHLSFNGVIVDIGTHATRQFLCHPIEIRIRYPCCRWADRFLFARLSLARRKSASPPPARRGDLQPRKPASGIQPRNGLTGSSWRPADGTRLHATSCVTAMDSYGEVFVRRVRAIEIEIDPIPTVVAGGARGMAEGRDRRGSARSRRQLWCCTASSTGSFRLPSGSDCIQRSALPSASCASAMGSTRGSTRTARLPRYATSWLPRRPISIDCPGELAAGVHQTRHASTSPR